MEKCRHHQGQDIMFLCDDCEGKLLCAFCLTEYHKGHNFEHIDYATPKRIEKLQRQLFSFEDTFLPALQQQIEFTDRQIECNDTEHKIQLRKIKRTGDNLKHEVDLLTASMISMCEEKQKQNDTALEQHKEHLQQEYQRVSSFIHQGKQTIRNASQAQICTLSDSGFQSEDIPEVSDLRISSFQLSQSLSDNLRKAFGYLVLVALDVNRYDEIVSNRMAGRSDSLLSEPYTTLRDFGAHESAAPNKELKSILVNKQEKVMPVHEGSFIATRVEITPEGTLIIKDNDEMTPIQPQASYIRNVHTYNGNVNNGSYLDHDQPNTYTFSNGIHGHYENRLMGSGGQHHDGVFPGDAKDYIQGSSQHKSPFNMYPKLSAVDDTKTNPAIPRVKEPISPSFINATSPSKQGHAGSGPTEIADSVFVWPKSTANCEDQNGSKARKDAVNNRTVTKHSTGAQPISRDHGRIRASSTPTHEDDEEHTNGNIETANVALHRASDGGLEHNPLEISNVTNATNFTHINYTVSEVDRKSTVTEQDVQAWREEGLLSSKGMDTYKNQEDKHKNQPDKTAKMSNEHKKIPAATSCAVQTSRVYSQPKEMCDKETMVYYAKSTKPRQNDGKTAEKTTGKTDKATATYEEKGTSPITQDKAISTETPSPPPTNPPSTGKENITTTKPSVTIAPFARVCFTDEKILPNNGNSKYGEPPRSPYRRATKINWSPPTKFRT